MLNNVPVPGQTLGNSRDLINANFAAINTAFGVNHVTYNDGSGNQGKHNILELVVQAAVPTFAATETGLYNKVPAAPFPLTTKQETFIHTQHFAGAQDVPMTASILSTATPAAGTGLWTYLPSGIILISGNAAATGLQTVTFGGGTVPTLTAILNVMVCRSTGGATTDTDTDIAFVDIVAVNQFRVYASKRTTTGSATSSFRYMVWGY